MNVLNDLTCKIQKAETEPRLKIKFLMVNLFLKKDEIFGNRMQER